jgi:NADPH:quinone reductase-like Zn-dependent oxidoreductase
MYRAFSALPKVEVVPDPVPVPGGVVLRVMASGVCLSDWHGSGDLACMARADGFGFVARGEGSTPAGTLSDYFPVGPGHP